MGPWRKVKFEIRPMLPPAQHVAMPGGTICKQRDVLEVAQEKVGFASLAIAMVWSLFVSAVAEQLRGKKPSQHGSCASRTSREARESRPSRSSLRFGGNSKDGKALPARTSSLQSFNLTHPDGEHPKTNRSNTKHVIITIFLRKFIGTPSQTAPPPWSRRSRPGRSGPRSQPSPGTGPVFFLPGLFTVTSWAAR
jgi:hypothetical protein